MPYYPGAAAQPPGLFGAPQADYGGMQGVDYSSQYLAGSRVANAVGGMGTGAANAVTGLGLVAGMGGYAALQSRSLLDAGAVGIDAVPSMRAAYAASRAAGSTFPKAIGAGLFGATRRGAYGAMYAADMLDPTTHMLGAARAGGSLGARLGSSMFGAGRAAAAAGVTMEGGVMGFLGTAASTVMAAGAEGGLGAAATAGLSFAGAGAAGIAGAVGGAAIPLAAGYAAYKGLEYGGGQIKAGYQDTMRGQALMNQLGSSVAPGENMQGSGRATGVMMREMSKTLSDSMGSEIGMGDIGRYAKQLSSQKVFQATRSAKEFRSKFKTAMKAVEEIAKVTKSSIDDAVQMFGNLRQQGFYTTADIKAQAAERQAREMSTGVSAGVFSAVGGAGSQMARRYGMRGRFGARMSESNLAAVSQGVRNGSMSSEVVNEMGGQEQVAMRMTQKQMSFMSSSRGRAMIAYSMGKGGAPDSDRLASLLGGSSMESIVTGAAGRGLGVLSKAGSAKAREDFSQYAGMAMISMAAAQQKQLYGGSSESGILRMMGTMGVNRKEAKLMLAREMNRPEEIRKQQESRSNLAERRAYEDMTARDRASGWRSRLGPLTAEGRAGIDNTYGKPLRSFGADMGEVGGGVYGDFMRYIGNTKEMYDTSGNDKLANEAERMSRAGTLQGGSLNRGRATDTIFGLSSSATRLGQQYKDLIDKRGGNSASDFGMTPKEYAAARKSGDLVQVEGAYTELGSEYSTVVRASDLKRVQGAYEKGKGTKMSDKEISGMRQNLMRDSTVTEGVVDFLHKSSFIRGGIEASTLGIGAAVMYGMGVYDTKDSTFEGVKLAGLVTSKQEWEAKTPEEKAKLEGKARSGLSKIVGGKNETSTARDAADLALKAMGDEKSGGLLDMQNLQSMRDSFAGKMSVSGVENFGKGDPLKSWRQHKLGQSLTKKKGALQEYSSMMGALTREGGIDENKAYESLAKLERTFGEGSSEYKAAKEQYDALMGMTPKERERFSSDWNKKGGGGSLLHEIALGERTYRRNQHLKGRIKGLTEQQKNDPRWKDVLSAFTSSDGDLTPEKRRGLMDSLFDTALGDSKLDKGEIDLFNQLNEGAGTTLASLVKGIKSGKVDDKTLSALGGGTEEGTSKVKARLAEIRKMDEKDRGAAIAGLLKEQGFADVASFGQKVAGGKSTKGVEEKYIAANEKFVQAVWAFLAAMPPVEGMPVGPVREAVDNVSGEGNNTEESP